MGRSPCCSKVGLTRGAWSAAEDKILTDYVKLHGSGRWRDLPQIAGLNRCGKSCRLRWLNYLRPDIKRGNISHDEEELILRLHKLLGNRWSLIAGRLPGRTDNEIKNFWNTTMRKRMQDNSASNQYDNKDKKETGISWQMIPSNESQLKDVWRVIGQGNSTSNHEQHGGKDKADTAISSQAIPGNEPQLKDLSRVFRPKAMRCSKAYFSPQPEKVERIDSNMTKPGQLAVNYSSSASGVISTNPEEDNPSNFMLDVDMGEVCFSNLLNSDFTGLLDSDHCNKNNNDLSFFWDGPLLFSEEIWTALN